jgi:hypothetical protein
MKDACKRHEGFRIEKNEGIADPFSAHDFCAKNVTLDYAGFVITDIHAQVVDGILIAYVYLHD